MSVGEQPKGGRELKKMGWLTGVQETLVDYKWFFYGHQQLQLYHSIPTSCRYRNSHVLQGLPYQHWKGVLVPASPL